MDKLTNNLSPLSKAPYHRSILAAMKLARRKLDRYYSLTDLSSAYRIAMGKFYLPTVNPPLILID